MKPDPPSLNAAQAASRTKTAAQPAADAEARQAGDTFVYVSVPELLAFVRRGFLPALLLALVAGSAAYLASDSRQPQYTAVALLLSVRPSSIAALPGILPPPALDPAIYTAAVHEGPVLDRLLHDPDTGNLTHEELQLRIRVLADASLQSSVLRVEATDNDALVAKQLADRTAAELIQWDRNRSALQITELSLQSSFTAGGQLSLLRAARVPERTAGTSSKVSAVLAAVLSVIFTYLLLLAVDSRVKPDPELVSSGDHRARVLPSSNHRSGE